MDKLEFLKKGLKNIRTTGTVTPSSRFLCEAMLKAIDFSTAKTIVELGPGSGPITRHILKKMRPDATLIAIELEHDFCRLLESIDDDRLIIIEGSAELLKEHLAQHSHPQADYIVSAIPFVILPQTLSHQIVTTAKSCLATDGVFIQMHYSTVLKKFYQERFRDVNTRFFPLNIPPAFIFECRK